MTPVERTPPPPAPTVPGVTLGLVVWRGVLEPHFPPLPWFEVIQDTESPAIEVHLVGLDSCSGLSTLSLRQVAAVGAIDPLQLTGAARLSTQ